VLTFFAGRVPVIFAAQHALTSTYLPTPELPPLRRLGIPAVPTSHRLMLLGRH
jgi:hypothetical protein